jgi:Polymyxin resistance protein PmrD.
MEWVVIDIAKTDKPERFSIITQNGKIKTITQIKTAAAIKKGDIIIPTINAFYYISDNKSSIVQILSSQCFTAELWAQIKAAQTC